jgi:hypothetical protein
VISLDHHSPPYGKALRQLQVVKFRGSDFRSGYHDLSIRHGGLVVYPRLAAAEHNHSFARESVPSGVAALDVGIERLLVLAVDIAGQRVVLLRHLERGIRRFRRGLALRL